MMKPTFLALFVLFGCVLSQVTIKIQVFPSSSPWWIAVDPTDDGGQTMGVEMMQSSSNWSLMTSVDGWPYFQQTANSGEGFAFPLSFRFTSETGQQVTASDLLTSVPAGSLVDTGVYFADLPSHPSTPVPAAPMTPDPDYHPSHTSGSHSGSGTTGSHSGSGSGYTGSSGSGTGSGSGSSSGRGQHTQAPSQPATQPATQPARGSSGRGGSTSGTSGTSGSSSTGRSTTPATQPATQPARGSSGRGTSGSSGSVTSGSATSGSATSGTATTGSSSGSSGRGGTSGSSSGSSGSSGSCSISSTSSEPLKMLLPLYVDPGSAWDDVITAASSIPIIAIINPDNGPTPTASSDYTTYIQKFNDAGIVTIGYVHTLYGERAISDVTADVDTYASQFLGLAGIFVDEVSTSSSELSYYQQLYSAITANSGYVNTIINPGAMPDDQGYLDVATAIVVFEDNGSNFNGGLASWVTCPPSGFSSTGYKYRFGGIGISTTQANMPALLESFENAGMGLVFATGASVNGGTYNQLPTYFTSEVSEIASLN